MPEDLGAEAGAPRTVPRGSARGEVAREERDLATRAALGQKVGEGRRLVEARGPGLVDRLDVGEGVGGDSERPKELGPGRALDLASQFSDLALVGLQSGDPLA
jgi:hypothetical protein